MLCQLCKIKKLIKIGVMRRKKIGNPKEDVVRIEKRIDKAGRKLSCIEKIVEDKRFLSAGKKQDSLTSYLESIRVSVQVLFSGYPSMGKTCVSLLNRLLEVSDGLKHTYLFPAYYTVSFDIFDTIRRIEKR